MGIVFQHDYAAYIAWAGFDTTDTAMAATGDGRVIFPDHDRRIEAHPDSGILCAALHPTGLGLITGGDDGRVVWTTTEAGAVELWADPKRGWIDAISVSEAAGLVAVASGKTVTVIDLKTRQTKSFVHPASVADLGFDPAGRKLYCATYNGVAIWFARIADQKPSKLSWAGSHLKLAIAPSGEFVVTAMQENALHGWRLKDSKDMRMGGYPAKIKAMRFFAKGRLLATSGASGAVVWPFLKTQTGPMGEEASEINPQDGALVSAVTGSSEVTILAAGLNDGRVWLTDVASSGIEWVKAEKGAEITAIGLSEAAGRLIFGDEDGSVYIFEA